MIDLLETNLMSKLPACLFKAQLLCLRSGRGTPRSLLHRD